MAIKRPYGFTRTQPKPTPAPKPVVPSALPTNRLPQNQTPKPTTPQIRLTPEQEFGAPRTNARLTPEQEFGTPRTQNVSMVGGNPTAKAPSPILSNTETINGVTKTTQSPSLQQLTSQGRMTPEQEFGTPRPSVRPVTPAPSLVGSTSEVSGPTRRQYSMDERMMITQSILENQLAGKPLTDDQRAFAAAMQTEQLFAPQQQVTQFEQSAKELEGELERRKQALQQEIEQTRLQQDERRTRELEQFERDIEQQYAPVIARAREQGEQATSTQERLLGATGALTGSIGVQAMQKIDQEVTGMINAIEAEKRMAIRIEEARREGVDADTISAMQQSLQNVKAQADDLKMQNLQTLSALRMEAEQVGNENLMGLLSNAMVETTTAGQKANDKLSEGLGYLVDDFGAPILSGDGQTIPYGASVTAGAKYLNTQQDPITGQFFAVKQDASGNIFAEPIMVGNSSNMEFAGNPNQNSLVAEYTQIFNGSSMNANGVDLAGKKGSPITSSIAGEVVFAGPKGGWGNVVQVRAADGKIHQFAHLDNIGVQVGQRVNQLAYLGGMGNTGNVLKGDGTPPTSEELAAGRGTHLDYTVYSSDGSPMGLETARMYAGIGERPFAGQQEGGQGLALTPQWQIQSNLDQQKRSEEMMKEAMQNQQKQEETLTKEKRELINSGTGTALKGATGLIQNIDRLIDYIETNGIAYTGQKLADINTISSQIAVDYKNAAELGALVGADWDLIDAISPRFKLTNLANDIVSGKANAENVLSALRTGRSLAEKNYNTARNTVQQLYPNVNVDEFAAFALPNNQSTATSQNQVFGVTLQGKNYQTKAGLTPAQLQNLQTLLANKAGIDTAIQQGLITPR